MALAKTTQDHDEIRKWAEERGGKPAVVTATEGENETGILRLMFPNAPNHNDGALEEISWEEFFEKFDASGLELTYQEKTADGQTSDFNKLVYPEPDSAEGKRLLKKSASKKGIKASGKKVAGTTAARKTPAKTAPAKKTSAKKIAVKKIAAKKTAGKKTSAKVAAKKTPAKKIAAKKTTAKKTPAKKTSAKKTSAKKTAR